MDDVRPLSEDPKRRELANTNTSGVSKHTTKRAAESLPISPWRATVVGVGGHALLPPVSRGRLTHERLAAAKVQAVPKMRIESGVAGTP